jgi:lipopolysaccharide/colanic/teichoic acid biosynthesis glycosyltransferase
MLIIAIAIKCSSKGPVFYSQERLGLKGKRFMLVKFRTMVADAEKAGAQWSQGDNDSRITKVGSILRKTRLDELPQLWACLKGDLSLVGPRPEREVFYNKFEEHVHGFSERLKVRPGLTGLAQVSGGYDLRPEEKVIHDVEYIKNRSLRLELKILFKTVKVVFTHDGAK